MMKISVFTGGIAQTNGYLIEAPSGNLAVDAPEGMAGWLAARGESVSHLLLTHQHFDHCQDAAAIQATGARVLAFAAFSRELTLELLLALVGGSNFEVKEFRVDEILEGRAELETAGVRWKLSHVPGHSADSITFYCEEEGLLMGGDVLFAGSIGRTDFPGGSLDVLLEGIRRELLTLPDATRVLPGHGPETSIGEERGSNPYLRG
jgi:hydroxyacylglutathione hydrolase